MLQERKTQKADVRVVQDSPRDVFLQAINHMRESAIIDALDSMKLEHLYVSTEKIAGGNENKKGLPAE